jgi:hypothetical protein
MNDRDNKESTNKLQTTETNLLNRVSKLSTGEFIPQTFNGRKIRGGDSLHFGKVDKVSSFSFGTSEYDECITGKLD